MRLLRLRTRCGLVNLGEYGELLYRKRFSLRLNWLFTGVDVGFEC